MDYIRRAFLTEIGEPLLVSPSPIEAAIRYGAFAESTGLRPEEILVSPLTSVPMPIYPQHWPPGRNRWAGIRPEAMWHPFFWLPRRVAGPDTLAEPDGGLHVEDPDSHAVRIALELSIAGLYDEDTGTWIDVLAMHGIDIDEPSSKMRVQSWLDGVADSVLDAIDLSEHLDVPENPAWAVLEAAEMIDSLRVTSHAIAADQLLQAVDDLAEPDPARNAEQTRWVAGNLARLGRWSFGLGSNGATTAVAGAGSVVEDTWWQRMETRIATETPGADDVLETITIDMADHLVEICDQYWPLMQSMAGEALETLVNAGVAPTELEDSGLAELVPGLVAAGVPADGSGSESLATPPADPFTAAPGW